MIIHENIGVSSIDCDKRRPCQFLVILNYRYQGKNEAFKGPSIIKEYSVYQACVPVSAKNLTRNAVISFRKPARTKVSTTVSFTNVLGTAFLENDE